MSLRCMMSVLKCVFESRIGKNGALLRKILVAIESHTGERLAKASPAPKQYECGGLFQKCSTFIPSYPHSSPFFRETLKNFFSQPFLFSGRFPHVFGKFFFKKGIDVRAGHIKQPLPERWWLCCEVRFWPGIVKISFTFPHLLHLCP